jgi:8-oxo-dGTP pyrophosphatase MutT (NUDIX family)
MAEVEAVPAASVIVLRDAPLEVLMIRRNENASFVPNAWVFPGGMVEQLDREIARERGDGSLLGRMRVAAARELFEESGVWLGTPLENAESKRRRLLAGSLSFRALLDESPVDFAQLVWTSHWITPLGVPKRFDTYFFLTTVSRDVVATVENDEAVEAVWITPDDALAKLKMVFPTSKNL